MPEEHNRDTRTDDLDIVLELDNIESVLEQHFHAIQLIQRTLTENGLVPKTTTPARK